MIMMMNVMMMMMILMMMMMMMIMMAMMMIGHNTRTHTRSLNEASASFQTVPSL